MENKLGNKIKALRQKHYKNQGAVAQKLGISIPAYSKIESGITDINCTRMKELAELFNIPTVNLLPDENVDMVILKANNDALKVRENDLQSAVIDLQSKLIDLYEENEMLKNKLETL